MKSYEDDNPIMEALAAVEGGNEPCQEANRRAVMRVQGATWPQEYKARLYLKTRIHMVMRLKNCSLDEAVRYVKQKNNLRRNEGYGEV